MSSCGSMRMIMCVDWKYFIFRLRMSSCLDWKCVLVAIAERQRRCRYQCGCTSPSKRASSGCCSCTCKVFFASTSTHFFLPHFQARCNLFCCKMSPPHANGVMCECATDSQSICRMCVASRVGGDGYAGDALSERKAEYDMQVRCGISIFHRISRVLR